MTGKVASVTLHRVAVPLHSTYNTAIAAIDALDTIVAEVVTADGRVGIGEATVVAGYTHETGDGAWTLCRAQAERMVGKTTADARRLLDPYRSTDPHAAAVLQVALEMAEGNPLLASPDAPVPVPILAPINTKSLDAIPAEIEARLGEGFRTLKVKVGWDVDSDLSRLALIVARVAGRAAIRVDANQGFSAAEGCRFVGALSPGSLQLFEQPCAADDWAGNAAVAAASPVPVMMDESIYGFDDIDRAGGMAGCGYVKLKIGKLTSVDLLRDGLRRVAANGQVPVLGNGAASDIGCWIEACVARGNTPVAGEMNGFLKNRVQLLAEPLTFADGAIVLQPGYVPALDQSALARLDGACERFGRARAAAG